MATFDYANAPVDVRDDIAAARRKAWLAIGRPGSWLSGVQRVAIAAEVRNASGCSVCQARKEALSPFAIEGEHDSIADLPAAMIDVIHRVVTDPGRLSRSWFEGIVDAEMSDGEYVELVIVLALTVAVDTYARAVGSPPWALPEAMDGEPTRIRPENLTDEGAYVPVIPSGGAGPAEADLYNPFGPNIYRAISLVPDQARLFYGILAAQYMAPKHVADSASNGGRAISRPQIELIAARVSALNGCFF